jgi:hypothetical protein
MKLSSLVRVTLLGLALSFQNPLAFSQAIQLNGQATTCQTATIVYTSSGLNVQTSPTNCITTSTVGGTSPVVTSVSPICVNPGAPFAVLGSNLQDVGSLTAASVSFSPSAAPTSSRVDFVLPSNAVPGTGPVKLNLNSGTSVTSSITVQVGNCPALITPVITPGGVALSTAPAVTAASAPTGSKIVIYGSGFTGATVNVGGQSAAITPGSNTGTSLEVTISAPVGATGGVVVINSGGSATAPLAITGNTSGGDVSLTGKILATKPPQVIPAAPNGDGGAAINAYDMPLTRCTGSPAVTRSWQHNINLADYRLDPGLDYVSMPTGNALTYKFTTPATLGSANMQTNDYTTVSTPGTMVGISTKPCDFDTAKLVSPTRDYCYQLATGPFNNINYLVSNTPVDVGTCGLAPNTTYYLNIRYLKASGGTYIDSCPANTVCGLTLSVR